jgi:group I intron endonuclease
MKIKQASVCGIYSIRHIKSGRVYIGSSVNIANRWRYHRYRLNKGNHDNLYLQRAWTKYGKHEFEWDVIEIVSDYTILLDRERHHIETNRAGIRKTGFNIRAEINGCYHSAETRHRISQSKLGKKGWSAGLRFSTKLSREDVTRIKERLSDGDTLKAIATDYGVGMTTVQSIRKRRHGWNVTLDADTENRIDNPPKRVTRGHAKLNETEVRIIKQMLNQGEQMTGIAREFAVGYHTIYAIKSGKNWGLIT